MALARALWASGMYDESLQAYARVMRSSKWVKDVVEDMEVHVRERPADPVVRRVLGDAYMRDGRLDDALEVYRDTLDSL